MPSIDEALIIAKKLHPAERLRLIERIWQSFAPEDRPAPTERELAEVYRRSTEQGVGLMDEVPWPIVERMIADCVLNPRAASIAVGAGAHAFVSLCWGLFYLEEPLLVVMAITLLYGVLAGGVFGYLAGMLVGGVFLVADKSRTPGRS